jgi:hypothetical protein
MVIERVGLEACSLAGVAACATDRGRPSGGLYRGSPGQSGASVCTRRLSLQKEEVPGEHMNRRKKLLFQRHRAGHRPGFVT